ncbi:helix-turn-helix transcriptional regulator [Paenibacillus beijingensis]|uniref:helix-turn-helix transcriptional regulator n=1 Tax=Paenibacillus beijingensis TaxID=1126833 RepID=UPI000696873A|nr:helix-turn-helix transcriptional regulator [Paenibacillus beijingensis]
MKASFDDYEDWLKHVILSTKLHIPACKEEMVWRQRLSKILNEGLSAKLTLLCAPAGYGKTTLVSGWAYRSGALTCWVSLDSGDDHPVRFWQYIAAAIDTVEPGFSQKMVPFLTALHPNGLESAVAALINEIERIREPLILVLDDFHVIRNETIIRSFSYFIHYLPAHLHLYMTSRTEPGFPLARLECQGMVVRVNAADLRFDEREGAHFYRDCMNLILSERDSALLVERTEGWIAAMKLAGLSVRKYEDVPAFIRVFSGNLRTIDLYLFEEIFSSMSGPMREFAMKCSILNRMNGSLCKAVTDDAGSGAMLEKLAASQLFIVPLDEQCQWYRFHQLFSGFLLQKLRQSDANAVKRLYQKAEEWCKRQGLEEEASDYCLADGRIQTSGTTGNPIRVLFVGDDSRWRDRLTGLLGGRNRIGTLTFVSSIETAFSVLRGEPVQVLLMDAYLNDCRDFGSAVILDITSRFPNLKVIVISASEHDDEAMYEAFLNGAFGSCNDNNIGQLADKIVQAVQAGVSPDGDRLRKLMVEKKKRLINAKDIELLNMILQGMTQQEIAEKNRVSLDAVKKRIKRILDKLNWHLPSKELARRCKLLGLLDP